ncbi:MAG TPA: leucyl aminopeptidase [Actinomycetota bacterium]|nr:leucyl aminopeptidase [Actinomycetota bacterium]
MEIKATKGNPTDVAADVLVVPLFTDDAVNRGPLKDIDRALDGALGPAIERGEVQGKANEVAVWPAGGLQSDRVLFVGAGAKREADVEAMRRAYGTAARRVKGAYESVALLLRNDTHARSAVEGFLTGAYEPDLLKAERKESRVRSVTVVGAEDVRRQAEAGRIVGESVNWARELVTLPPNDMTPTALADAATETLVPLGVKVEVLTGDQLARFGGLRGVAQGSSEPPVLITMSWEPGRARKGTTLGLVGKGVTFDSGGLSLKPSEGMETMKADMAGAAAVLAAMRAIAALKLPVRVRAACPATENMPSGTATRVGDVLRMYSGKTVEVLNTDAEGRLILADALAWLAEQGVTHMADAATLTGAVQIALGNVAFGVFGRPDRWVDQVLRSARASGERAWPLPLYPEYREQLRSDVADVKNVGGRPGGAITAATFLAGFVPDEIPWAHLDIAATAWQDAKPYRAKGATGSAVRTFVQLASDLASAK